MQVPSDDEDRSKPGFAFLRSEMRARLYTHDPRAYREFFPGKEFCADGCFYLHDGTAWSFFKAGFLDE